MVFKKVVLKIYPILLSIVIAGVLFATNYTPNTWLTGWDNTHPEFNFGLNIYRNVWSVWREHRGLGLVSGLAHSAQFPFQLIQLFFSIFVAANMLRYLWQFLMLGLGFLGAFYLIRDLILRDKDGSRQKEVISILGAFYYVFNLSTLQVFFVPLETFTTHYGALPWLFLFFGQYILDGRRSGMLKLLFVFVVSLPQAFTPTLFFALCIYIGVYQFSLLLFAQGRVIALKRIFIANLLFLLVNSLWLVPWAYFVITRSSQLSEATINQLSSDPTYLENRKFGTFRDVAILRGPLFQNTDYDLGSGSFVPLMGVWKDFQSNPGIDLLLYVPFVFVLLGFLYSVVTLFRRPVEGSCISRGIALSGIILLPISFFLLLTSNPPFGSIFDALRNNIPLLKEALRLPFTKFSVLTSLIFVILLARGLASLPRFLTRSIIFVPIVLCLSISLFIPFWPVFQGNLVYKRLRVNLPDEYLNLFKFSKTLSADERILKLPVHTFWSWEFHSWGYRGSGFLWFGLDQAITERAFDVWSPYNENLYKESHRAVYGGDLGEFKQVLRKYNLSLVLLDSSIVVPGVANPTKYLGFDVIESYLEDPDFELVWKEGYLSLYKFKALGSSSTVRSVNNAAAISGIPGQYITSAVGNYYRDSLSEKYISFPFSDITLGKGGGSIRVEIRDSEVSLSTELLKLPELPLLSVPNVFDSTDLIAVDVSYSGSQITLQPLIPSLKLNDTYVPVPAETAQYVQLDSGVVRSRAMGILLDGKYIGEISDPNVSVQLGRFYVDPSISHNVKLFSIESAEVFGLTDKFKRSAISNCSVADSGFVEFTEIEQGFILSSSGNNACVATGLTLPKGDYVFRVEMSVENDNSQSAYCIFLGDSQEGCLNATEVPYFSLKVEEDNDYDFQVYSEPTSSLVPGKSTYSSLNLVSYELLQDTTVTWATQSTERTISLKDYKLPFLLELTVPFVKEAPEVSHFWGISQDDDGVRFYECSRSDKNMEDSELSGILEQQDEGFTVRSTDRSICYSLTNNEVPNSTGVLFHFDYNLQSALKQTLCLKDFSSRNCGLVSPMPDTAGEFQGFNVLSFGNTTGQKGISVEMTNSSVGNLQTVGEYRSIVLLPFVSDYVTKLNVAFGDTNSLESGINLDKSLVSYTHPLPWVYRLSRGETGTENLVLMQSYDPGWVAFCSAKGWLPRVCGEHFEFNSWANIWLFSAGAKPSSVVFLIFVPQLLGLIGLGIFIMSVIFLVLTTAKKDRSLRLPQGESSKTL